jgi:perosamine synthetase
MFNLSPSPKNRLHTSFSSYSLFLSQMLLGKFQKSYTDVEQFEIQLKERFGAEHAICVYQCRLGLYFATKTLIKPGQEVILSPYTLIDVINMVIFAGGRPVFADVDPETCNISPAEVERLINANTGAVMITHLHGLCAEAHRIKAICDRFNVPLIEDAAQSFGAKERDGKPVGMLGDVGVFSFEMHKNLPTWLGGAVVTNRSDVAEKIRAELSTFTYPPLPGIAQKVKKGLMHDITMSPLLFQLVTYPIARYGYLKDIEFINSKLRRNPQVSQIAAELPNVYKCQFTPLQGKLGMLQLKNVDSDIKIKVENAHLYYEGLKNIEGLRLPPLRNDGSNAYLWFPVQCENRESLLKFMFEQGRDIAAGHFTNTADSPRFAEYYRDCPKARQVEQELIFLPTYPRYPQAEIRKNIEVIQQYFKTQVKPLEKQAVGASY